MKKGLGSVSDSTGWHQERYPDTHKFFHHSPFAVGRAAT